MQHIMAARGICEEGSAIAKGTPNKLSDSEAPRWKMI